MSDCKHSMYVVDHDFYHSSGTTLNVDCLDCEMPGSVQASEVSWGEEEDEDE